ncbi:hypothetical protein ACP4OV_001835 [Aristida adscensionis]
MRTAPSSDSGAVRVEAASSSPLFYRRHVRTSCRRRRRLTARRTSCRTELALGEKAAMAPPRPLLSACARAPAVAATSRFASSASSSQAPAAAKKPAVVLGLAAPYQLIKMPAEYQAPPSSLRATAPSAAAAKLSSSSYSGHRLTARSATRIATAASSSATKPPPAGAKNSAPRAPAAAGSGAKAVHPARRLACGAAVFVRTPFVPANVRCRILLWLPARVVAASGASHYTVKYAADLNPMFAGKVVRLSAEHVREAPRRPSGDAAATTRP